MSWRHVAVAFALYDSYESFAFNVDLVTSSASFGKLKANLAPISRCKLEEFFVAPGTCKSCKRSNHRGTREKFPNGITTFR